MTFNKLLFFFNLLSNRDFAKNSKILAQQFQGGARQKLFCGKM